MVRYLPRAFDNVVRKNPSVISKGLKYTRSPEIFLKTWPSFTTHLG